MNWIRECVPCTVAATARARAVFPVPGASSSNKCPSANIVTRANLTTSSLPNRARPTLPTIRANVSANQAAFS